MHTDDKRIDCIVDMSCVHIWYVHVIVGMDRRDSLAV